MSLDSEDVATLTERARVENRLRMLLPMMLTGGLLAAVLVYFRVDAPPTSYYVAGGALVFSVFGAFVVSKTVLSNAGNAREVLAGKQATAWMRVEAIGDQGNAPYQWSFRILDEPGRFVHASVPTTRDFEFRAGEQYLLYGFGDPDKPYGKTVYFTDVQQTRRHWDFRVQLSDEEWNTAVAD